MPVLSFSDKSDSCFAWTVEQMLEHALSEIREGRLKADSAIIVFGHVCEDKTTDVFTWRAQLEWKDEYIHLGVAKRRTIAGRIL